MCLFSRQCRCDPRNDRESEGGAQNQLRKNMKVRQTQLDMRANTAAARRHVSRLSTIDGTAPSNGFASLPHEDASGTFRRNQNGVVRDEERKAERSLEPTHARELNHKTIAPDSRSGLIGVNFEPLLDVTEAARLLRIHPKTLRLKARSGEIPGIQIGRVWRFRVSALDRWVERAEGSHLISVG
jgi:excisionase family DNA binding protein